MNNEEKLKQRILELSFSDEWLDAKNEWKFIHAYKTQDATCLCSKPHIANVCVIENKMNHNIAEVGNCCVTKFLDITDAKVIFSSINKLQKNIKSNITETLYIHLIMNKLLSRDDERLYKKFLYNFESKKTSEEWNDKIRINQMILDHFTSSEGRLLQH